MASTRLPRPATVIAVIALVISLSGSALAATHYLITSTGQIKPNVRARLHGATGPKGSMGATGAAGVNGASGATGAKGDTGPPGANGINGTNGMNGTNGSGAGGIFLFNEEFFGAGPFFCGLTGGPAQRNCASLAGAASGQPMPIACTLKSLRLVAMNASGTGADGVTAAVRVNGTATSLTASATTTGTVGQAVAASDLTDTVAVSVGDVVGITVTRTSGTDNYDVGTGVVCQ